jgi:hypothetical protein
VVGPYKGLARVERAFRSLKTVDLHHHWLAGRADDDAGCTLKMAQYAAAEP